METRDAHQLIKMTMPLWHYWFFKPFKHFLEEGITREMSFCMLLLYVERRQMSMTELAQKTRVSKQQMTKVVNQLIAFDFVKRTFSETDRRIILVEITEKGISYQKNHRQIETEYYNDVLNSMSEEDRETFLVSLENIHRILNELPHCDTRIEEKGEKI